MHEIMNKVLLVGDKFMTEMPIRQPGFMYKTCGPLQNLKKQEIQDIETNYIKPPFNMIWLIEILRIYPDEQFLMNY